MNPSTATIRIHRISLLAIAVRISLNIHMNLNTSVVLRVVLTEAVERNIDRSGLHLGG